MEGVTLPVVSVVGDLFGFDAAMESDGDVPDDSTEAVSEVSCRTSVSTGSSRSMREVLIREGTPPWCIHILLL